MTAVETHSQQWHEIRASGVGGSEVAGLLGLSRYASPWSLWAEKTGLIPAEHEDNERLEFGREAEPYLAAMFHRRTGLHVAGQQMMVRHPEHGFARATLDGLVFAPIPEEHVPFGPRSDALGIVQFKTWATRGWPDGIPPAIRAQTIWEMACAGLRHAWVGVLFSTFRFEVFELPWDDDVEADWQFMLAAATEFWRHVEDGTPPPVDGSDATADAIAHLWPTETPDKAIDADPTLAEILARRAAIKARVSADEKVLKGLDNELASLIGDAETIRIDGAPAFTYRAQSRTTVDRAALEAEHPAIAAAFTRISTYRVLRPGEGKK